MTEPKPTFQGWAILELMGHRKLAGWVQQVELAGAGMLRIDVPAIVQCGICREVPRVDQRNPARAARSPRSSTRPRPSTA